MRANLTALRVIGVIAVATAAMRCSKRSAPSVSSSVAPAASDVPPSAGSLPARAGANVPDCAREHLEESWRPRQSTSKPRLSTSCSGVECVSVEPLVERRAPCAERGPRCRPVLVTPRVKSLGNARADAIQKLLDAQLVEVLASDECWVSFLDYALHHDQHGILDLSFRYTGVGAYPSTHTQHVTVDVATGERVRAAQAFHANALRELAAAVKQRVDAAWSQAAKAHPEIFRHRVKPAFGVEHLESFIVHTDGVVFFYDFGLAHSLASATPASEFPFTKAEIRRFVDPGGPLRFLRTP